jgi:hypothetical protein
VSFLCLLKHHEKNLFAVDIKIFPLVERNLLFFQNQLSKIIHPAGGTTYLCDSFPDSIGAFSYERLIIVTGDDNC